MSTLVANVGASMTTATGRPGQGHLVYAQNLGQWWCFYLSSTAKLSAVQSSDFNTWAGPSSGSPMNLVNTHHSEGRNFAFAYANLAGNDIVHMVSAYGSAGGMIVLATYHSRFTLGSTWTQTNTEASTGSATIGALSAYPSGVDTVLDSNSLPVDMSPFWLVTTTTGEVEAARASNADSGSSWTAGFGTPVVLASGSTSTTSNVLLSLGSGSAMAIGDDSVASTGQFTGLLSSVYSSGSWSGAVEIFGSAVTATDTNAWGAVARTNTDVHVVALSDGSSNYVHYRWNGSTWSAGDSIPSFVYGTNSGIFLATDGTSVWLFAIENDNTVEVSKWVSGVGWSAWSDVALNASTATYLSGCQQVVAGNIGLIWTLVDGSNYDIAGTLFNTTPGFPVGTIACSQP